MSFPHAFFLGRNRSFSFVCGLFPSNSTSGFSEGEIFSGVEMEEQRGASSKEPPSNSGVWLFTFPPMTFLIFVRFCCFCLWVLFLVSVYLPICQLLGEKRNGNGLEEKDDLGSKRVKLRDLDSGNSSSDLVNFKSEYARFRLLEMILSLRIFG